MLTNLEVTKSKSLAKIYRLFDGNGLYLEIHPNGAKYWRLKYRFVGKEKRLCIGKFPDLSLLEAREKRDEARQQLIDNVDPAAEKKERRNALLISNATTFELVAREWHEHYKERWSEGHAHDVIHRMEMDIFPKIGDMPIADIKPIQLLQTLRVIEKRGAFEMARRALQYCGLVFRYAVVTERCERDGGSGNFSVAH